VKVVRAYSKWWDFPYCSECADWRRALQRAEVAESAYTTRLVTTWLAGVFAAICLAGGAFMGLAMLANRQGGAAAGTPCIAFLVLTGVVLGCVAGLAGA